MACSAGGGLDRRVDDRHRGDGLFLSFEGGRAEVIDVSVGGLKFYSPSTPLPLGTRFPFELHSADEDAGPVATGVAEVRAARSDWVSIEFVRPTFSLMKVVVRHIGRQLFGRPARLHW